MQPPRPYYTTGSSRGVSNWGIGLFSPVRRSLELRREHRSGHSLIEMLMVVMIVVVLIAIAVPAVQRARESARMTQCIANQGELAKAVRMYVTTDDYGRYPGYRTSTGDGDTIGWAAQVFTHLGRNDLSPKQATYIETLVCPSDSGSRDSARMNYVVNGGQAGTDSPADGIFFDHTQSPKVYITNDCSIARAARFSAAAD